MGRDLCAEQLRERATTAEDRWRRASASLREAVWTRDLGQDPDGHDLEAAVRRALAVMAGSEDDDGGAR